MANGAGIRQLPSARFICALLLATLASSVALHAATDVNSLPQPRGYVNDFAHVLNSSDEEILETFCTRAQQQLGVQLALVTIDTLDGAPIENFSLDLARKWGVGGKGDNSGILLLLVIKDRKSRVEVGRGVEPYVTDGLAGSTLRSMRPELRAGNYGAALLEGAREIATQIAQGKGIRFDEGVGLPPRVQHREPPTERRFNPVPVFIIAVVFAFLLVSLFKGGGRGGGGGSGFWTGFLLSALLNSGRRDRGGWGGGGFGGDSGGGGGFGGFGGGDFGGGGASSDW